MAIPPPEVAPPPPPPAYDPGPAQPQMIYVAPPPPPKKHTALIVAVVVIVVVIIAIIAGIALLGSSSAVDVTAINITSSDNACGVNGHTFSGFTTSSGGAMQNTFTIPNKGILTCTINSVSSTTSGFSLSGANTPVSIPAQGTESVSFTIHCPNSYNGVLTIDFE